MKMNEIEVFGLKVKIKHVPLEQSGFLGLYNIDTKCIEIDEKLEGEEYLHTLLHEALHAVIHRISLSQVLRNDIEEIIVDSFSTFIVENFLASSVPKKQETKKKAPTIKRIKSK